MIKNTLLYAFGFIFLQGILLNSQNAFSQWTQTAGPPGINVNVFYQKGQTLYSGTSAKGVFKSSDHGITWSAANGGIENKSVSAIASQDNYLYAGTNDGIYRSTNNGASWTPANTGIEGQLVVSLLVANGYLFAGTISFGLFKSNDHGNTWTEANGGALGSSSIYGMCFSSPNLIVMADNLIFYSNNNGNTWFIPDNSPFIFSTTPSFLVKNDSVMVSAVSGVFRSFDKGQSWGPMVTVNSSLSISGLVKTSKVIYAGGTAGIFSSKNFGSSWKPVLSNGLRIGNRQNHHFFKSGSNFLLAFDEVGVAYSMDKGKNWTYTLSGFPPASNIDNALLASGSSIISGTHSDGVYQTLDKGSTWTKIGTTNNNDTLSNSIIFSVLKTGNIVLAGTCGFGLYRSSDNGVTWSHITNGLPKQSGTGYLCVTSLAQSSTNILIGTDQGLYYSTDNGLSWNSTNISGTSNEVAGIAANGAVACATVNGHTGPNKIYRSTNGGVSWSSVFSTSSNDFTCIASDGVDHFYAGTFTSNFSSSNNGVTWQSFGPGIPSGTGAFAIAAKGDNVFVGNSGGIYFSDDNASSFSAANTGLDPAPNNSVQGFAISSEFIYAGLFQDGVWKRPLSDFGITLKSSENIAAVNAHIAPNPASSESILTYDVDETSYVRIVIYNSFGRTVKELVNGSTAEGTYQEKIDLGDLPPGDYFVSVVIGETMESIRLAVVK